MDKINYERRITRDFKVLNEVSTIEVIYIDESDFKAKVIVDFNKNIYDKLKTYIDITISNITDMKELQQITLK